MSNEVMADEVRSNEVMAGEMLTDAAPASMLDSFKKGDITFFTSKECVNDVDRKVMYNALSSPDKLISENIGEKLVVKDVAAFPVKFLDENTGEEVEILRTILIDDKGLTWSATSAGIANSVTKLFAIYGMPTWNKGIPVQIKQVKSRNSENKTNILVVV